MFCNKCKIEKSPEEFYPYLRKPENQTNFWKYKRRCKKCSAEDANKYRNHEVQAKCRITRQTKMRNYVWEYWQANPCVDCGETDPLVLEFDHVRGKKHHEVSRLLTSSKDLDLLKSEIAKCDVVCANCHRKRTYQRGNHWRYVRSVSERSGVICS